MPEMEPSVRISEMVKYMKSIRRLDHVFAFARCRWLSADCREEEIFVPIPNCSDPFKLLLLSEGITQEELNQMEVKNPAAAFALG